MSETNNTPNIFSDPFRSELEEIVERAITKALNGNSHQDGDHLLDAEEAAKMLAVSPDWLYRHASRLPFTRKLGPKMLRFSYQGIQKWLATRKSS